MMELRCQKCKVPLTGEITSNYCRKCEPIKRPEIKKKDAILKFIQTSKGR
jgi:Zn finger protein HypA/HybF involved in hydrogenase expression